jgi:hypothetical protein
MRQVRLARAIEASTALLSAALDPEADGDEKLGEADAVLDRYLGYEPGCGPESGFCDAEELTYPPQDIRCGAVPGRAGSPGTALACAFVAIALFSRRRHASRSPRRRREPTGLAPCAAALAAASCLLVPPSAARAQAAVEPLPSDVALSSSTSGAVDETALAAALGAHYRVSNRVLLGLGTEWNPWASLALRRLRPGTLNTYGTAIFRPFTTRSLALRTTAQAGTALLLFDLYGAPSGSVGPYLGLSLVGLEIELSRRIRLVLDPAHVAVAVPQVRGIPLSHRQYRATVTLELWL